ncbi:hypothetical protein [uncultured Dokdonia sp.]|uniref:hypothetical protein n=1 Tax=uncultured Dokdonia sp. TaxID=575653 RepID=UPI002608AF22|nr:hypothetical protein [uncultured Dokdonia sp.]
MKKTVLFFTAGIVLLLCTACPGPSNKTTSYEVNINQITRANAPALQSFAHATSGDDWLLFAGRTNKDALIGGIHNLNANYADSSFIPKSFNTKIYTYNPKDDTVWSIDYKEVMDGLNAHLSKDKTSEMYASFEKLEKDSTNFTSIFVNSNPLVTQDNGYLYLVGGYGPKNFTYFQDTPNWHQDTTATDKKKQEYITYDQVVRLHIASLVKLTKKDSLTDKEWANVFRYDTNTSLVSTGAEVLKMGSTFYVAGGHDFTSNSQKYLDAVYPFTIKPSDNTLSLGVRVGQPISDVSDPTDPAADNTSIFRRRDGPVTPSIYYNATENRMEQSLTFYGGVFKPGEDLQAWNNAIYVHPDWATQNKLYTYDTSYNQDNFNVYACGNFVGLDNDSNLLHTFLLGGIGDGKPSSALSGFTNTGLHVTMDVKKQPLHSVIKDTLHNVFGNTSSFYGAESILIKSESNVLSKAPHQVNGNTVQENTEIIDLKASFRVSDTTTITIGHIYGGIEAFESNPGTYGQGKSAASNKIWEVTLTKKEE